MEHLNVDVCRVMSAQINNDDSAILCYRAVDCSLLVLADGSKADTISKLID